VSMLVKDEGIVVEPQALAVAKVVCHIVGQGKAKKIRVYKRKRKNNYARLHGHRQEFTDIKVDEILDQERGAESVAQEIATDDEAPVAAEEAYADPTDEGPADESPVDESPVNESPVNEGPADESPAEE
jgi:large subunit ribosomal protein L21